MRMLPLTWRGAHQVVVEPLGVPLPYSTKRGGVPGAQQALRVQQDSYRDVRSEVEEKHCSESAVHRCYTEESYNLT